MLIITRKVGEGFYIGKDIYVRLLELNEGKAQIGIAAPQHKPILREELKGRAGKYLKQKAAKERSREPSCFSCA
jgi:carbon storage regulator